MDARDLYRAGRLSEAIGAMNDAVRSKPADVTNRGFLAELLCVAGKLDRADAQLEIASNQQPEVTVGVSLIRQLIRAARSRQEFFEQGRVPDVLSQPSEVVQLQIEASVMVRSGDDARAGELLAQAEEQRTPVGGTMDGARFDDFRDLDDLIAGVFEVLTSTGKYYWVPIGAVSSLVARPPERPLDLVWLPFEMSVRGGPDGVVYLPTTYGSATPIEDEQLLLGRATEWDERAGGCVRGRGLRTLLVGEEDRTILQLGETTFDHVEGEAE